MSEYAPPEYAVPFTATLEKKSSPPPKQGGWKWDNGYYYYDDDFWEQQFYQNQHKNTSNNKHLMPVDDELFDIKMIAPDDQCPFCESDLAIVEDESIHCNDELIETDPVKEYSVRCFSCGTRGPLGSSRESALKSWCYLFDIDFMG